MVRIAKACDDFGSPKGGEIVLLILFYVRMVLQL